jgi:cytochrome b561
MSKTRGYGPLAKLLHWTTAALLAGQFLLGWLMPDIGRGMSPGAAMGVHLSIGMSIFAIALVRYLWRLAKPVPPAPGLPAWQRASAEMVHLLLYALLLVTTTSGWIFASTRGWTVRFFGMMALPSPVAQGSEIGHALGGLHGALSTVLLIAIAVHVLAALAHAFRYRDGVMQRMLPNSSVVRGGANY